MIKRIMGTLSFTVALLLLLTTAAPALAADAWSPNQGASPAFIQGLANQTPATGHTQTPGVWEYDHIQSGYTELQRPLTPAQIWAALDRARYGDGLYMFDFNSWAGARDVDFGQRAEDGQPAVPFVLWVGDWIVEGMPATGLLSVVKVTGYDPDTDTLRIEKNGALVGLMKALRSNGYTLTELHPR